MRTTTLALLDLWREHARICQLIALGAESIRKPELVIESRRQVRRLATENMKRLDVLMAAMDDKERAACLPSHEAAAETWRKIVATATADDDLATRPMSPAGYNAMKAALSEPDENWQPPY